ncbi:hypothetical protein L6R52_17470, partial [Myxococcota bacterium]|nr:hypothetical protein [Myxococcota bacterium]
GAPLERAVTVASRAQTAAPDGRRFVQRAERTWRFAAPGGPPPRYAPVLAYDSARDRVVMFGGISAYEFVLDTYQTFSDTWEWDGRAWHDVTPAGDRPRTASAMTYDAARGRTVLFDGARTWLWDGARWTVVTGSGPSPRSGARMVYDAARQVVVLYGGGVLATDRRLDDTWLWDGAVWRVQTPPTRPTGGIGRLLYDDTRARVVLLIGGEQREVWTWDGATWTLATPASAAPSLVHFTPYFDVDRGRVVLAAAVGFDEATFDWVPRGTWEWDDTGWSLASVADGPRFGGGATYDRARRQPILVGGRAVAGIDPSIPPSEGTWTRVGDDWVDVSPTVTGPSARQSHAMVYDEASERVLLYGGRAPSVVRDGPGLDDLWAWDGRAWSPIVTSTSPGPRAGHKMVYDRARHRTVLFGGAANADTWELTGSQWSRIDGAAPQALVPRREPGLAYDADRGRVVLFGGRSATVAVDHGVIPFADTWEYDGATWRDVTPASGSPDARFGHGMIFDALRHRVVAFGGSGVFVGTIEPFYDVFAWDGAVWDRAHFGGSADPVSRRSMGVALDERRGVVVTFGGFQDLDLSAGTTDAWEWSGNDWLEVTPPLAGPPPGTTPQLVYDRARDELVSFASSSFGASAGETWILSAPERPAVQLAAQLPADLPRSAITELYARGVCGGSGTAPGAELVGWSAATHDWTLLDANTIDASAGAALEHHALGGDASVLAGPEGRVHVQCRSVGTSTPGLAEVAVDYLEVRVRFHAP